MSYKKIRVLVIDDSALVRAILCKGLAMDPMIEVVGAANDPYQARDMIIQLRPDVLTLDVEMPRMDGVEFLRKLMPQYPIPTVMVSSLTERGAQITLDALDAGAIDFVIKPHSSIERGIEKVVQELMIKIKIASTVDVSHWKNRKEQLFRALNKGIVTNFRTTDKVVAIGASTGGTEAIRHIICNLPYNFPGMVIVQHMPKGFTKLFSERLNRDSRLDVVEAKDGDRIITGRVLIAPGDQHMEVVRRGGQYIVRCYYGEIFNGHCPSVSVLFDSVAKNVGQNAVGVMLTGMGRDGADEMLRMKQAGATNIIQDESSCVVYGMPKAAYDLGAADYVKPLSSIAPFLVETVNRLKVVTCQK